MAKGITPITHTEKVVAGEVTPITHFEKVIAEYGGGGGGFTPTQSQLAAMNSGITEERVEQITTNESNILLKANTTDVNTATANLQGQVDTIFNDFNFVTKNRNRFDSVQWILNEDASYNLIPSKIRVCFKYPTRLKYGLIITAKLGYDVSFIKLKDNSNYVYTSSGWVDKCIIRRNETFLFQIRKEDNSNITVEEAISNIEIDTLVDDEPNYIDIFMFMGQSNMAGRGISTSAHPETYPQIIANAGYEFRAISNPLRLVPIAEPFGVNENNPNGIDDRNSGDGLKSGSLVTAFTNAYYKNTNVPIIGISASKGGSSITEWQPNGSYLNDAIQRLTSCISFIEQTNFIIRHKYIVWCQGETDTHTGLTKEQYFNGLNAMINELKNYGVEKMFLIRIGNRNTEGQYDDYTEMIEWQTEFAQTNKDVVMVSCDFAGMRERGLMKDDYHYVQEGYNECGSYAGTNTALYVNTNKEPNMYDSEDGSLYYSHKN